MIRRAAQPLAAWLLAMGVAFAQPIASGFALGFGDRVDALIEIGLLEHWLNVFAGTATWNAPGYFHPHAGTLGYNDGYLLSGLIYAAWRQIADAFLADTLVAATWKTIGFFAAHALVARSLGWGRRVALLVAVLFTIANGMTLQAVHAQLQTIALLPVTMILAIAVVRTRSAWPAVGLAILLAAWLMTAYYMAWFTLWFACLFVLALLWPQRRSPRAVLAALRPYLRAILAGTATFALGVIPFLAVYLPTAAETGEHRYRTMLGYLVTPPFDMVNVGPENLAWGWIWHGLMALVAAVAPGDAGLPGRVLGGEHASGFALLLFALFAAAAWRTLRHATETAVLRAFALAIVIGWALAIQLWLLSPWGLVFLAVPGAAGLRVVLRFQLFLILPVLLLVAAVWRTRLEALCHARPWRAAAIVFALLAEQINLAPVAALDRASQRRDLWRIPPPPRACRSFYVVATRTNEPLFRNAERHGILAHNVDAMLLAARWRVPTLNGYATFRPPDWDFADPLAADYDARVLRYVARHRLSGVCRLDMRAAKPWRPALR